MQRDLRELDFIRWIAVVSIILIHVSGRYVEYKTAGFFLNQLVRFAVPAFVILSGYLLRYRYSPENNLSFNIYIKRRFNKILIPYLCWTVIYLVFGSSRPVMDGFNLAALQQLAKTVLTGSAADHLYFVVIIFQMYLAYPVILYLMKRWEKAALAASFIATFYFQLADYLYQYKIFLLPASGVHYYGILFPTWVFYFVLGCYLQGLNLENWLSRRKTVLAVLWFISYISLVFDSKLTFSFSTSIKPSIMLYAVVSYLLLFAVSLYYRGGERASGKLIKWLAGQSYLVYLSHLLVLNKLVEWFYKLGFDNLMERTLGMLVLFLTTIGITLILVYIVSLSPFASVLGGERKPKGLQTADIVNPL